MKKTILMAAALIVSAACFAGATRAATINGFANGGFEVAGTTTPAASWVNAAEGYTRSTDARTGSFSALLSSPETNAAVFLQNSTDAGLPDLIEGDNPLLSFWAKGNVSATGNVLFGLRYLNDTGAILASGGFQFQNQLDPNNWTNITFDLGAVPVGATAAFIEFSEATGPFLGSPGGMVLIDDVVLTRSAAVPEPASATLLGLGGLVLITRRRRR
jgi:hypothetical protein